MTPRKLSRIGRFRRVDACTGKHRFSGPRAKRMADRRSAESGESLHAYPCPFCGHWHIGHTKRGAR